MGLNLTNFSLPPSLIFIEPRRIVVVVVVKQTLTSKNFIKLIVEFCASMIFYLFLGKLRGIYLDKRLIKEGEKNEKNFFCYMYAGHGKQLC